LLETYSFSRVIFAPPNEFGNGSRFFCYVLVYGIHVGNLGQLSYSACNAFQDSLAQYRGHVLGLPGLAINWGPIGGARVMERQVDIAKLMTVIGLGFVDAKEGT